MYRSIIIGAGQAGLSAAHFLTRKGLAPGTDFLVLDANQRPGGAWAHRWPSLTLGRAHRIADLPDFPLTEFLAGRDYSRDYGSVGVERVPAAAVVPEYFAAFERRNGLRVQRPRKVAAVSGEPGNAGFAVRLASGRTEAVDGAAAQGGHAANTRRDDDGERAAADASGSGRVLHARTLINATGTWDSPYWPYYPGADTFAGRQLHTHDFRSVEEFRGQRVLVVGAGTSAVQFLLQLEAAGIETVWSTRRPPEWTDREFDARWGARAEQRVAERTLAGLPPRSVVSATGLPLTEEYQAGIARGVLRSRGPLRRLSEHGAVFEDGGEERVDAVLWATGFRASLGHLAPLKLREPGGGILMSTGVQVAKVAHLYLVGYGPSASTLGATRAGRAAAKAVAQDLGLT